MLGIQSFSVWSDRLWDLVRLYDEPMTATLNVPWKQWKNLFKILVIVLFAVLPNFTHVCSLYLSLCFGWSRCSCRNKNRFPKYWRLRIPINMKILNKRVITLKQLTMESNGYSCRAILKFVTTTKSLFYKYKFIFRWHSVSKHTARTTFWFFEKWLQNGAACKLSTRTVRWHSP